MADNLAEMIDNPPTDNPPTDNPTTDNPPTDNPPTDNPPTDNPPTGPSFSVAEDFSIESVPEKFVKDGKVDVSGVLSGFTELEKGQSRNDGFIGEVPEAYEFTVPTIEGVESEEVAKMVSSDDPIVSSFQEFAKAHNFTQKAHDRLMGWFVKASMEAQNSVLQAEMSALGDKASELIDVNKKFFAANLSEEGAKGINGAMVNAAAVKAINEIRLAMGDTVVPGDNSDDVPGALTEQSLKAIMKSDAYWNSSHEDYGKVRDQVEQGFAKLYKEEQSAG